MTAKRLLAAWVLIGIVLVQSRAEAGAGRAWSAARDVLPADTEIVLGANVATIRGTKVFARFLAAVVRAEPDVQEGQDIVRKGCGIEMMTVAQDIVVAMDREYHGAVFIALTGVGEADVTACLTVLGKSKGEKITAARTGNIVEYSTAGASEKLYMAWLGQDVLVIATDPLDRRQIQKWTGGKGAVKKTAVGKQIAKVDTSAALWGVVGRVSELAEAGIKLSWGQVTVNAGTISADVRLKMNSARDASRTASFVADELKQTANVPPELVKIMRGVVVAAAGAEVSAKAMLSDDEAATAVDLLIREM